MLVILWPIAISLVRVSLMPDWHDYIRHYILVDELTVVRSKTYLTMRKN